MTHDLASLYVLDALDRDERRDFEQHLREGCVDCRRELEALEGVNGDLALLAPPTTAPATVRSRLLDAATREPAGSMAVIRANEGRWIELGPGVHRKDLTCGPDRNVFLLRMDAGARGRKHTHAHVEHCYVIEGDVSIVGLQLGAGDHHIAGKGTVHDGLTTDRGCLLLLAESLV